MRIIAGKHKGRKIELAKEATGVRPTSEFAREAIFNILTHNYSVVDKDVLDVFCGTGAFGLEALSRGAKSVTFIDQSREALLSARHNATRMNEAEHVEFVQANATKLGRARKSYGLIFLDPPYFEKLLPPTLESLHNGGWISPDGLIVAEHDAKENIEFPPMFEAIDQRKYGRALVRLLKLT